MTDASGAETSATIGSATLLPPLRGVWLGRRAYAPVLTLQERLFEERRQGLGVDTALFVEHEPVITRGRGTKAGHVLVSDADRTRLGVELHDSRRGGDVTLHAPGQLVGYPIVQLGPGERDVRKYVRSLSRVMERIAAEHALASGEKAGLIGLWADRQSPDEWRGPEAAEPVKIGAIGVRISRWITMHGFALNLTVDLDLFRWIVPCGIRDLGVASIASLSGSRPRVADAARAAFSYVAEELGREPTSWLDYETASLDEL